MEGDAAFKTYDMSGLSDSLPSKPQGDSIPPAPPYVVPSDHRFDGYGESLFGTEQEYTRPIQCKIVGKMPSWLTGTFIRVGPGRFEWGPDEVGHFFDGDGMAHRWTIEEGDDKVVYQSKFLKTKYHEKNNKYNRITATGLGTWVPPDPCANIFKRMAMYIIPLGMMDNDNANVNVFEIQGKTYVATESPWMTEIDRNTLDTIKVINGRNKLDNAASTWLAHPHYDTDGCLWMFNTRHGVSSYYDLIKIPPTPGLQPLCGIELFATLDTPNGPGYYHSFAFTQNYVIMVENPLTISGICSLLTMEMCHKTILELLQFKPEYGTVFRFICKKTGKEFRSAKAKAFFVFHHANAYEKDGEIIMDMCSYSDDSVIQQLYMKNCKNNFKGFKVTPPNLVRYKVPVKELMSDDPEPYLFPHVDVYGGDHVILSQGVEGPIVNYDHYNGRPYKYCYGIVAPFVFSTQICKVDVDAKTTLIWEAPKETVPAFPFFVANPNGKSEDDGVVVTNCIGVRKQESFLLVLDAKTLKEVCRAVMPVSCGFNIHATFFS